MKNSHKFWMIFGFILLGMVYRIYPIVVLILIFSILFVSTGFIISMFSAKDLYKFFKQEIGNLKMIIFYTNPVFWLLLGVSYFNRWIDGE